MYQVWIAAKSKRGEGATTPPIVVRTEQYGKSRAHLLLCLVKKVGGLNKEKKGISDGYLQKETLSHMGHFLVNWKSN